MSTLKSWHLVRRLTQQENVNQSIESVILKGHIHILLTEN